MAFLVFATLVFVGLNAVNSIPGLKGAMTCGMGKAFGPAFGIASLLSFVLLLWAMRSAPEVAVYTPPSFGKTANYFISGLAFLFFGIALFRGRLRNLLRYPLSLAIALLATGHLLTKGELASLIFFVGFLVVAVLPMMFKKFEPIETREGHDLLSLMAGVAMFGVMTQLHTVLIGVNIINWVK